MANTKIINLKRYSKKRVPKKVLKGGMNTHQTQEEDQTQQKDQTQQEDQTQQKDQTQQVHRVEVNDEPIELYEPRSPQENTKIISKEKLKKLAGKLNGNVVSLPSTPRNTPLTKEEYIKAIKDFETPVVETSDEPSPKNTTEQGEYEDWINISDIFYENKDPGNLENTKIECGSISIKLNDDLKVPYPYFLEKINEVVDLKYKVTTDNYIKLIGLETQFDRIKDHIQEKLRKYYNIVDSDSAAVAAAVAAATTKKKGGAEPTTPEDFIMLMAKWCFIIWGYKTLNRNFCNKYLESKKPSSSYTKEQLSLDYRRKITGITRIYRKNNILTKNQFVIKASLNKAHIPDYENEIKNYEKLWKIYKETYNEDDNKFKVLKYFGSSQSEKWHKEKDAANKGYKGYLNPPQGQDEDWKKNNLVWEYNDKTKVLTILNKIHHANPLKISTNLNKHAEAIDNNSDETTSNVCWFAIEWDPDFIPFSTSHSGEKRDLKLDQTVLQNMRENIYHLSEQYGFYHGDLHTENFLYNIKGDIRRFDFDFSGIINKNHVYDVPNDQINIYFGWQPSKISMFLFFNLYKNGTWNGNDDNDKWNPTADDKKAHPKHQHLEFLRLFDTHRMLLHYFLSTKGPYNTNVNDIKDVIENIFTEEGEEKHKKILIESVTNNMYTFWNGSATKKEYEKNLGSDMVYENTWNAGCMYSLLWYFGKYEKKNESDEIWKKWYDYDNHLKFFEIHLKNLLKKLEG